MRIIQPVVSKLEKIIGVNRLFVETYVHRYLKVVEREIKLAHITKNDVVLNVGCGALPFTAILISRLTGAKVIAVDRDEEAVTRGQKCLKNLGLDNIVDVRLADASEEVPRGFTVAIVALQAEPKMAIVKTLSDASGAEARIVFRQPRKAFNKHYDRLPDTIVPTRTVFQDKSTFDTSILLEI